MSIMKKHKATGLWLQYDHDEATIKEAYNLADYGRGKLFSFDGKVVLDIGANIGLFAARAFKDGAKKVICVEPNPALIPIIKKNAPKATIYQAAIGEYGMTSVLTIKSGINAVSTTTLKLVARNGKTLSYIDVDTIQLDTLISRYKPDIIKFDAEGSEWKALREKPKCKILCVEWHSSKNTWSSCN